MPIPAEPDLERGDGALSVPTNPFASSSPTAKPTPSPNSPQQRSGNQPMKRKPHQRHQSQHLSFSKAITPHDPNATSPKLLKLRSRIGISTNSSLQPSPKNPFSRPAPNLGIYTRIIHEERSAKFQFYFAASVINTCYFGQICIAAALTALGASGSSNIAITVLGAANTVLAGVLTYLKGQGLPNRLRMYWSGLRKCREFIEEKERECAAEGYAVDGDQEEGMDVDEVIDVIVRMYHDVRQTAESMFISLFSPFSLVHFFALHGLKCVLTWDISDNTPDTYLPMQGSSANALARSGAAGAAEKPHVGATGSVRYPVDDIYNSDSNHDDEAVDDDNNLNGDIVPKPAETPEANSSESAEGQNPTPAEMGRDGAPTNGAVNGMLKPAGP
ncbi:MAG: hypothetical protein Q9209_005377 [Squamulea sp. 1 TL-2023]